MPTYPTVTLPEDPNYLGSKIYTPGDDRSPWSDILSPGVMGWADFRTQWVSGMTLKVDPGTAWIPGGNTTSQGIYRQQNTSVVNIVVNASHPTSPRLDQAIVRVMDADHDASGVRVGYVQIVPGVPTAGATLDNRLGALDLTTLEESSKSVLHLADILVGAGVATLSNSNSIIRDRRIFASPGNLSMAAGMKIISQVQLRAASASIDFSSLPFQFAHLLLFMKIRATGAATQPVGLRFDNISSAVYHFQNIYNFPGTGNAASQNVVNTTSIQVGHAPGDNASDDDLYGSMVVFLPNFSGGFNPILPSASPRTVLGLEYSALNGSQDVRVNGGYTGNHITYTSLQIVCGSSMAIDSKAWLYGLGKLTQQ